MDKIAFSNNAETTLTAELAIDAGYMSVADAGVFPTISGGEVLYLTLFTRTGVTESDWEIVRINVTYYNNLYISARAQEGTTARVWPVGTPVALRWTAGEAENVITSVNDALSPPAMMTRIKTVDGTGSGLDADLVDGLQAASFVRTDVTQALGVIQQVSNRLHVYSGLKVGLWDDGTLLNGSNPYGWLDFNAGLNFPRVDRDARIICMTGGTSLEQGALEYRAGVHKFIVGDVQNTNFTSLGSGAPAIKQKLLTGTTPAAEGGTVMVAHGLTQDRILSVQLLVNSGTYLVPPSYTRSTEHQYDFLVTGSTVQLMLTATNSGSILSKSFTVLITYQS